MIIALLAILTVGRARRYMNVIKTRSQSAAIPTDRRGKLRLDWRTCGWSTIRFYRNGCALYAFVLTRDLIRKPHTVFGILRYLQPGPDGFEQPEAHRAPACERDHEAHAPMLRGIGIT